MVSHFGTQTPRIFLGQCTGVHQKTSVWGFGWDLSLVCSKGQQANPWAFQTTLLSLRKNAVSSAASACGTAELPIFDDDQHWWRFCMSWILGWNILNLHISWSSYIESPYTYIWSTYGMEPKLFRRSQVICVSTYFPVIQGGDGIWLQTCQRFTRNLWHLKTCQK